MVSARREGGIFFLSFFFLLCVRDSKKKIEQFVLSYKK